MFFILLFFLLWPLFTVWNSAPPGKPVPNFLIPSRCSKSFYSPNSKVVNSNANFDQFPAAGLLRGVSAFHRGRGNLPFMNAACLRWMAETSRRLPSCGNFRILSLRWERALIPLCCYAAQFFSLWDQLRRNYCRFWALQVLFNRF